MIAPVPVKHSRRIWVKSGLALVGAWSSLRLCQVSTTTSIFIFHFNIHSPDIPRPISLFFCGIHCLKLKTNEFVYDVMLCFPLNPYQWHVVLITVLPTQPRFGFCMHNFWTSPIELSAQLTMTSSNGNIFCVTGPFCGEFTGDRWTTLAKATDAELWCVLWSAIWFAISIWSIPRIGSDWPNLPWLLQMPWLR